MRPRSIKKIVQRLPGPVSSLVDNNKSGNSFGPLLLRIFENRNINDYAHLEYPLSALEKPDSLKDGEVAAGILADGIRNNKNFLIIGDYDTDGATASALGLLCLPLMGARYVDYLVPNRFDYGYGLSKEIATVALSRNPDIVITVDNGISSVAGVDVLKNAGVEVVITDHHLPGLELPRADAILNPNQPGCMFPSKVISGVGVMFYLLLLLRARLATEGWFDSQGIKSPNLANSLDLVALGTIADLVPLDYNNRILAEHGLARIRAGRCRPGIIALLAGAGKNYANTVSQDLGFIVAPRLNAAGRMEDISTGIECLIANSANHAVNLAGELEKINSRRKIVEGEMQVTATRIVDELLNNRVSTGNSRGPGEGFCLYDESWHQGITGLVASRIKDKTDEPVIAFANSDEGKLTGSARSVPGLHMRDLLESVSVACPDLIEKFGGHAMAAGMTIQRSNLNMFSREFHQKVKTHFIENADVATILTDGELQEEEITLSNAEDIRTAAPWGQGFPAPVFEGLFDVVNVEVVGDLHLKLTLQTPGMSKQFQAIAFRALEIGEEAPEMNRIYAVYQLDVNEFRGKRSLQLIVQYWEDREVQ